MNECAVIRILIVVKEASEAMCVVSEALCSTCETRNSDFLLYTHLLVSGTQHCERNSMSIPSLGFLSQSEL